MRILFVLILLPFTALADPTGKINDYLNGEFQIEFPSYQSGQILLPIYATVGVNAPTVDTDDQMRSLCFTSDNHIVYIRFFVPIDWNATSDLVIRVLWYTKDGGTPLADGETIEFDFRLHSPSILTADEYDKGNEVLITGTHTQSGAGVNKALRFTDIVIDYDNIEQPLARFDRIVMNMKRDQTNDTYAGDVCIDGWAYVYYSKSLPLQ